MKFFLPFWWQDRVYGDFDPWEDNWSLETITYPWDVEAKFFDGLLFSRSNLEKRKRKLQALKEGGGLREVLNIPEETLLFGDCGAYSYKGEDEPEYEPLPTLEFYEQMQYDFACTVDHLITSPKQEDKKERFDITLNNAKRMMKQWKKEDYSFELVGVAQGWDLSSYWEAVQKLLDLGFSYLAIGGVAPAQTDKIRSILEECSPLWRDTNVKVHIFGAGRKHLLPDYKKHQITSFDSALQRGAWLSRNNNYSLNGIKYTALRIPYSDPYSRDHDLIPEEREVLQTLQQYAHDRLSPETLIAKLKTFEEELSTKKDDDNWRLQQWDVLRERYLRILNDKPWERCSCPFCEEYGVHVGVFRGNNRNMRRGWHNVFQFYRVFQQWQRGDLDDEDLQKHKEIKEIPIEDLKNQRVLVITSCSKRKASKNPEVSMEAKHMYQGRLFKRVKNLCDTYGWDYKIISAKHDLIDPEESINYYDKTINSKKEILQLRRDVEPKLAEILPKYDEILVVAGKKYRKTMKNLMNGHFLILKSKGYADLCKRVKGAKSNSKLSEYV